MSTRRRTTRLIGTGLVASGLASVAVIAGATLTASAAPSNAPSSISGTFSCTNGDAGTFVVNSGNGNGNGTTWNVAHLSFDTGGRGVFSPTGFDLTFSFDGQMFTQVAQKNNASKGDVMC